MDTERLKSLCPGALMEEDEQGGWIFMPGLFIFAYWHSNIIIHFTPVLLKLIFVIYC